MDTFIQLTVAGRSNGAILALAALGFVLIYKASGVINFAQGQFLLIGAYVVWALTVDAGLHWALAVAGAIGVAIVLGLHGHDRPGAGARRARPDHLGHAAACVP